MNTDYAGIDYSMGQSNYDKSNGIHYGVISQNEVLQSWADSSEPYYGEPHCPHCGNEVCGNDDRCELDYYCAECDESLYSEQCYGDDPISYTLDDGEYIAECGDDGDIFITKSPYYTNAQFCSPCAPGAGYLMNHCPDGPKTYCFGHDWFDSNIAPYPIYRVSDNSQVLPE